LSRSITDDSGDQLTQARRDRFLMIIALLFFALWLFSIGPARTLARHHGFGRSWAVGVAPNFFAGLTFAAWQGYRTRTSPWVTVGYAMVAVSLAEFVQLFLPHYTADPLDAIAGIAGALLAFPLLSWRRKMTA
jgi:predicted branched-subunit amino acid permease